MIGNFMKKKKKDKKLYNYIKSGKLYLVLLFVCVLFLSIGYATVTGVNSTLSGTAEAFLTKGEVVTKALNAMHLDAMLVGNIDFSFGKERLAL